MKPEKMKAAVYYKYGLPDVVRIDEINIPSPNDKQVLIKVHAATVNRTDCGFRSAEYFIVRFFSGLFKPKRPVLGNEFAGEIIEIGKAVTCFKVGDKVFGYNDTQFGAHAEYMVMDEDKAIAILPKNYTYEKAAPILEGCHYAYADLKAAKLKSGQKILINGGTGGIGSAAVQLSKYLGAEVTAVCSGKHFDLLKSLGADVVIDYHKEDFTQRQHSFDVVFDAVGKSSFGKCKPILNKGGIYMSTELGKHSQNPFLAMITPFLGGKKVLFPIPFINKSDVLFFKDLVEQGKFTPVVDKHYTLNQIVDAYTYVETGEKIGNVVININ